MGWSHRVPPDERVLYAGEYEHWFGTHPVDFPYTAYGPGMIEGRFANTRSGTGYGMWG